MKIVLVSLCLALSTGAIVQDRAKKPTADDTPKLLQQAQKAFEEKRFGACVRDLKSALGFATGMLRKKILATLPPAPAGHTIEDAQQDDSNPVAHMLGMTVVPAERVYRAESGDGEVRVTVHADSPAAAMLGTAFGFAAHDPKAEAIGYKSDKGLLKTEEGRVTLQILISGKHLVDVTATGMDGDTLLKMFDQTLVDKLAAALND